MRVKRQFIAAAVLLSFAVIGCNNAPQGFNITTYSRMISSTGELGLAYPIPYVPVSGQWVPDQHQQGSVTYFNATTDRAGGGVYINDGRAPAYWNMYASFPDFCNTSFFTGQSGPHQYNYEFPYVWVDNQTTSEDDCLTIGVSSASTRFGILGQLPQTVTLGSRSPMSMQFGAPQMYVYDDHYNFLTSISASSVASDGLSATFPFPNSLSESAYTIALVNANSDGSLSSAGGNFMSIASSQTIPGNPFGVSIASQSESVYGRNTCGRGSAGTTTSLTIPVVSLYSLNQVLAGNVSISVGSNPTTVLAYNGPTVTHTETGDCYTAAQSYSGMTRALVANSGTNTISVLDLVNNVVLNTVTVGSQPVALTISPDASTAYVANYGDGTISQVNLASASVTATLTVGGNPTSVALTASGVLWVGGVGFLDEVNPQTMTVTAIQSIPKSVAALAYSDLANQLVVTAVDGNGGVFSENVNPNTVTSGNPYSPTASNKISGLVSYGSASGVTALGYSKAVAGTGQASLGAVPNPIQVGAPPLVVQDGWAVITGTPTGFSVTDVTGNVVLISEQTPSPVTAIAVDSKLSVAYLTLPDSNLLLMVPLPGTK